MSQFTSGEQMFFVLYMKFPGLLYREEMEGAKLLAEWLVPGGGSKYQQHTEERWPDVCSSCFHQFGPTVGGRLRFSCCQCPPIRTRLPVTTYEVQQLAKILGLSMEQVEMGLATAVIRMVVAAITKAA